MNYRLVVVIRQNNQRDGKPVRRKLFSSPDKQQFKQAIKAYHLQPRQPWAETAYYYGQKRIYAYEL